LEVDVDEAQVRAAIEAIPEKEGFDWYLFLPEKIKNSDIWKKMEERFTVGNYLGDPDKIRMPRTTKESYAVATHYSQEPDEDSVDDKSRSFKDWEQSGETFMTPLERMVAELRWFQENGTHLDEKYMTVFNGSRLKSPEAPLFSFGQSDYWDRIPLMRFYSRTNEVTLNGGPPQGGHREAGVRRVITKESKV